MTDLSDFGGGVLPEKRDDKTAHDSRSDRAKHRRQLYRIGRCRAISTSKGCRCGGGIVADADGPFCAYHQHSHQPVTIDSPPELLARWCGAGTTAWEDLPALCQLALTEVADG